MFIEKFKNIHKGKRVFVVGNGPSLNNTNLDLLKSEHSLAMNRISLIYKKTVWRPKYFVCTTTNIRRPEWKRDIMRSINMGIKSFVWDELKAEIGDRKNVYYINCSHGNEVTDNPGLDWWSNDISKRVCKFGTTMLVALQIAVYMGFNPIYIIGADLGYQKPRQSLVAKIMKKLSRGKVNLEKDSNHFVSSYNTPGLSAELLNQNMVAAHELAKKASQTRHVDIINATVGGNLEVYPRANYYKRFN